MRDVLYKLNQESNHLCVKYFLSKAFPEYEVCFLSTHDVFFQCVILL